MTRLTSIHYFTPGQLRSYINDLFPKRRGQTFNSECCEVALMQHRCKEAEFSMGVAHCGLVCRFVICRF